MSLFHVLAQAAIATLPTAEAAPKDGVISYPPAYFASFQPSNAMEMVNRVPGFSFDGGDDDVRGFGGAGGNVLIDGQRPAAKSDNLENILRRLPSSNIERVDLIRGSASGIDMQGKAVLLNIIRKNVGGFRGLASVATNYVVDDGRTAPQMRLEASGGANGRAWELGLSSARFVDDGSGDGPRLRISPTGAPLIRSFVESEGGGGEVRLTGAFETPLLGGKFRVNGVASLEEFDYTEQNRRSFPTLSQELDQFGDDEKEIELGARFSRNFGPRVIFESVLLQRNERTHFGETFQAPGSKVIFSIDATTDESIVRNVLKYTQSDRLSFEAGAEGAFNSQESETEYLENGVAVVLPAANVRVEETRGEVFGKATWRPTPKWTIEAGLRQEASKITASGDIALGKTLYFTKPRLAVTWAATPSTQLRGRIEREVGQLDFEDFVAETSFNTGASVQAGNPDLNPGQAWVGELTLEQRFWGKGALVVTYRHFELKDVIDSAPVRSLGGTFDSPGNIGDGTKDEFTVNVSLPLTKLGFKNAELRGQTTWRESRVSDPTTGRGREISGLRPLSWEARFTHDLPRWHVNWGADIFGAWRETNYGFDQITDRKLKTFVKLFAEWKPQPDLSIKAELINVTERGLRNTRNVYAGPRDIAALLYTDDRDIQFGRMIFVRVRKTFGA